MTPSTATMKPKTVVTIQYLRTRWPKLTMPSAMCGRVSRMTASRSAMVPDSKARKITMVMISTSSDSPPLTPLSSDWAGPASVLGCTEAASCSICCWPKPSRPVIASSESRISANAVAYRGRVSTRRTTANTTEPQDQRNE